MSPPSRLTGADITIPLARGEKMFIVSPEKIMDKIKKVVNYQF